MAFVLSSPASDAANFGKRFSRVPGFGSSPAARSPPFTRSLLRAPATPQDTPSRKLSRSLVCLDVAALKGLARPPSPSFAPTKAKHQPITELFPEAWWTATTCATLSPSSPSSPDAMDTSSPIRASSPRSPTPSKRLASRAMDSKNLAKSKLPSTKPTARASNLLDRIRAKQTLKRSKPQPSKAENQRKAAVQRSEEVLDILVMAASQKNQTPQTEQAIDGATNRFSFSLTEAIERVKESSRSPISREEVIRCIELLAELKSDKVSLVSLGQGSGRAVVVRL
ncbi:hypothetical protein H2199_005779 [Coniosporium tulheliwenetii]|uniref:Uncharacterized protein n=1 Tax=Coniosporium tulheliwenetii TaxID=3383036 RepID=A0ACC2Z0P0_9PEZI|nr:hypothetical protein H2199_005779 [Cladosporium sp. JES 115]